MNLPIPIITDETGKAIAAAISQTDVAQQRIAEINAAAQQIYDDLDENYPNYSQVLTELQQKTEKVQIDYEGENVFKLHDQILNYADIHRLHIESPDFAFIQYRNRAYLLSYVQDDPAYMREMRFESVIATTESNLSFVKTSGIYVKSSDGVNIAGVDLTDITSENKAYKATSIDDDHKNDVWYPTVKAVADYVDPIRRDIGNLGALTTPASNLVEAINQKGSSGQTSLYKHTVIITGNNDTKKAIFNEGQVYLQDISKPRTIVLLLPTSTPITYANRTDVMGFGVFFPISSTGSGANLAVMAWNNWQNNALYVSGSNILFSADITDISDVVTRL